MQSVCFKATLKLFNLQELDLHVYVISSLYFYVLMDNCFFEKTPQVPGIFLKHSYWINSC